MSQLLDTLKTFFEQFRFAEPQLTNDAITFGILAVMLGCIFWADSNKRQPGGWAILLWLPLSLILLYAVPQGLVRSGIVDNSEGWGQTLTRGLENYLLPMILIGLLICCRPIYRLVPMLLMCYFAPSLLTAFGWVDPEESKLYFVATRFLLPASLVLLTISIDLREIVKLGPKALIMFFAGTLGVVLGGPIAVLVVGFFSPDVVGGVSPTEIWRGLSTVAGSWIGGGANQAAMKEIFLPDTTDPAVNERIGELYSVMVAVDVVIAEIWMFFLLLGVGRAKSIDRFFKADASAVDHLQQKMEEFSKRTARVATSTDLMVMGGIAFGITAICHLIGDWLGPWIGQNFPQLTKFSLDSTFFWLIVLATTFGVGLSFTRCRNYEGAGASRIGTVFIFILVATIGLKMDIFAVFEHPELFLVGGIWMIFHVGLMFFVGYLIRAPYFFLAVGSKANIGGAASAPVVAAAFHPSLAPVGVLLAVLGYALGTYGAWLCAIMMQAASPASGG